MTSNRTDNYIGVVEDYQTEEIIVWERNEKGRHAIRYPNPYYFYVEDDNGEYMSMYNTPLKKLSFNSRDEFKLACAEFPKKYESDFSVLDKTLMDNYYGLPSPILNYAFFDIEVDVDDQGFATPSDARCPINAITIYQQWLDTYFIIALPPPNWDGIEFMPDPTEFNYEAITNVEIIFAKSEVELLALFLELLVDCDFISGWNSEFFDIPYIYNRIVRVLGENAASELCFTGAGKPRIREVERFGKKEQIVILQGRSHLDYLAMFKKFTFEGRASFALANICEEELGLSKLEYDGSLKDLYEKDFKHFVTYNLIDVYLLVKLDKKFSFVALVNQMAHENTVPFDAILGTTRYVDVGTSNYAHHYLNKIVKDKDEYEAHDKVEGAIVLTPNRGLHEWVGSVDINSLYPSVLRSLNISPETYIGQFETPETFERIQELDSVQQLIKDCSKNQVSLDTFFSAMSKEYDWRGIKEKDDYPHTALISGEYITKSGKEWNEYFKERKWVVSAYGTIFDQSCEKGIVPSVLQFWYSERKALQKELKSWKKKLEELKKQNVVLS